MNTLQCKSKISSQFFCSTFCFFIFFASINLQIQFDAPSEFSFFLLRFFSPSPSPWPLMLMRHLFLFLFSVFFLMNKHFFSRFSLSFSTLFVISTIARKDCWLEQKKRTHSAICGIVSSVASIRFVL